jgi:hypothetical protein
MGPTSQFIIGASVWIAFPLALLVLGREFLLLGIGVAAAASGVFALRRMSCSRCVNFSCPMNAVAKEWVDSYLARNPGLRSAWEARGYRWG